MAEKVAKLGVSREKDFMYYVKDGAVWKVQRKQPGVPKGKPEKVEDGGFEMDTDYIYFVDKDGDVSRAKRAIGGQRRKKSARKPAARKATRPKATAKKSAAKKSTARKAPAKSAMKKSKATRGKSSPVAKRGAKKKKARR